jgi:hypothetical protein
MHSAISSGPSICHAPRKKEHAWPDMHDWPTTMHGWVAGATQCNNPGCMQGLRQVVQHSGTTSGTHTPSAQLILLDVVMQVVLLLRTRAGKMPGRSGCWPTLPKDVWDWEHAPNCSLENDQTYPTRVRASTECAVLPITASTTNNCIQPTTSPHRVQLSTNGQL